MSHVSVRYRIYLPGGHHRQPRNTSAELQPNPTSEVDVATPGSISPLYIPELPYVMNGASGMSKLLFWSVSDGTAGQVFPAGALTQLVGANPLVITAWYYPISGPGYDPTKDVILDAFSTATGGFVDDNFVNVTNEAGTIDADLTAQANVVGVLATKSPAYVHALPTVTSTGEPFSQWLSFGAGAASTDVLRIPTGADGVAFAVFKKVSDPLGPYVPTGTYTAAAGMIIGGVAVDGGGWVLVDGKPHPIDPWGPLVARLLRGAAISIEAAALGKKAAKEVRHLTQQDAIDAMKATIATLERDVIK